MASRSMGRSIGGRFIGGRFIGGRFIWLANLSWLSLFLWPASGHAGSACSDVQNSVPNSVVVAGAPSAEPLLQQVASLLQYGGDPMPMTIIWQLSSNCGGVEAVASATTGIKGQAKFWPLTQTMGAPPKLCDLDATNGTKVDLALSDVFPATCPSFGGVAPTGVLDIPGPVMPYALVMAPQASETAMQAEEGHFVFGTGMVAGVTPWTNNASIFVFGNKDAGQLLLAPRFQLTIDKWHGTTVMATADLITGLQTDPAHGIGILPTSLTDTQRSSVRVLAFQAIGQHGAFYPDRKSTTFDKQNVRDGHYPLWGFLHALVRTDANNQPLSQNAARLANILLARTPQVASQDTLTLQVQQGLVPSCAMQVTRTGDSSPLIPFTALDACGCWFENTVPSGVLGCSQCPSGTCAVGVCRRNYCEVQ